MSRAIRSSDPMKPTPTVQNDAASLAPLLAFGAHPDDIEFGCGGVIAVETNARRAAHLVVCSKGEAASHGTPQQRVEESQRAAGLLGATVEFIELDGDAHLEYRVSHTITLAAVIRRVRPGIVLAPTTIENQHPDHAKLGRLVRDACRLARYGGVAELRDAPPHAIGLLLFYAVTTDAEPPGTIPVLVDVSPPRVMEAWRAAMEAHASQAVTRPYVEFQLAQARVNGLRAGIEQAIALFPSDPLVVDSLARLGRGVRHF
jgi:N-acetylglucosamine malate deacetylase 1